jgi:hypothetical protein
MKKLILGAGLFVMATTVSCKKEEKGSANTWSVNGTQYKAFMVNAAAQGSIIWVLSQDVPEIKMEFKTFPASSGNYKIVDHYPGDNEITFNTTVTANESYTASGDDGKTAVITVSGATIRVQMTDVKLSGLDDRSATGTFSCDITGTVLGE